MNNMNIRKPSERLSSLLETNGTNKAKILIVEDEAVISADLQKQLEHAGYSVPAVVTSGEEAVKKARECKPDLLLIDIKLRGKIDGIEAASQIISQYNIPVIYLTAYADNEILKRAKITGPYGYLHKPVEKNELLATVEIALVKHHTENALKKSKDFYCRFINSTTDISFLKDDNFRFVIVNRALEKFFGKSAEEIIGKSDFELTTRSTAEICRKSDLLALQSDNVLIMEELIGDRLYETRKFRVLLGNDRYGIGSYIRDITERRQAEEELRKHRENLAVIVDEKSAELISAIELLQNEIIDRRKTEEALRESEKRYRGLFNYMSSGVAVYEAVENGTDFVCRDFNNAGEQIDRIKKEALIGKRVTSVFPGFKESGLFEMFQRVWKTAKPGHNPILQYTDERISGWREYHVYKLPSGEIIAIYNDITEQVRSAERESSLLIELKTIFENFPVGIVYLDNNYRIISSNKFFNDFAGFRQGELAGKICFEVVGEFANDPSKKGLEKVCSFCKKGDASHSMTPTAMERPLKDKFVRVTTIPERDEGGNIFRFMEIVEDITERKLAEAEVIRASHLAALGELAAGVAHEINNPINGIINYTQMLANKSVKGSRENDIALRIIKESDRIASIVSNLLSFARDRKDEKIPVNIKDILQDTFALTEAQMIKDGITIIRHIPSVVPTVIVQPQQIEQVFLNIISNARYALNEKYQGMHDDKMLEIGVSGVVINDRPFVRILFHDTGTGIPSGIMDKIMNPFFSTKSNNSGTGLGLSISHGIIIDHGGILKINSVEGAFTKVTIELPAGEKLHV